MVNMNCRSIFVKIFLILFAFSGLFLSSQLISSDSVSKTEAVTWFEFEPNEEFVLDGSKNFLKESSTIKYYNTVANFFSFYDNSSNSLGVKLSWDRLGSHYADIVPVKIQENPFMYPVEDLQSVSIWLWSPGYQHELAAIFKRQDGFVYSLKIADLNFKGWKKFRVKVPIIVKNLINSSNVDEKFFFDRFRIYTSQKEKVGDIYLFLDNFDVVQELYGSIYDGLAVEEIIRKEKFEKAKRKNSDGTSEEEFSESSQSGEDSTEDSSESAEQ